MQPSLSELSSVLFGEPTKPKFKQLCENIFDVPRSNLLDVLEDLQNAFWSDESPETSSTSPTTTTTTCMPAPSQIDDKQARSRRHDFSSNSLIHKRPRLTTDPTHFRQQQINTEFASLSPTSPGYDQQPTSPSPPSSPGRHTLSEPVYAKEIHKSLATTDTQNNMPDGHKGDITPLDLWSVKWQLFKQLRSINHDYKENQVIDLWHRFQRQGTDTEIQHMARYLLPVACSMRRWTVVDAFRQVLVT